jgi:hypothetical protein
MGIIHKISFDRRRCCSISGYRNVLILLTLELLTLVTKHVNILYKCSFNLHLWCCVPGCSNSEGGHRFPKDSRRKIKWTVAIQRLDPSTDSDQRYSDTSNIPYIFHIKQLLLKKI